MAEIVSGSKGSNTLGQLSQMRAQNLRGSLRDSRRGASVGRERLEPAWNDLNKFSAELTRFLIMSMFLCACGSWALIAELQKGTWAFEMGTEHLVQEPRY